MKSAGFNLIELMIVVSIVGILAAIAYPSYRESVRKGNRTDAQAALTGLAAVMERDFLRNNGYRDVITAGLYPARVPLESGAQTYALSITSTATTYTLSAAPSGGQSGDRCGTLTLASSGAQGPTTPVDCWRR
ncbi:type IV pilin protein [Panacagrimonas perspica]|uniref:type IV pilin protein n=1 Tax=Panacagrimonas perspica TaxID=381431 RepID=UPI002482D0EA|nr:type IV pilin protein [Panacagrimonas perspica]